MNSTLSLQAQALHSWLFPVLGAGFAASPPLLAFALLLAHGAVWLIIGVLVGSILRRPALGAEWLVALLLMGCASLLSHELAKWIGAPRPFMIGLSPVYLYHDARAGFPSNHASALGALTCFLLLRPQWRLEGFVVLVASLAVGWSRIYLGLHFPLDILAGFVLGAAIGALGAAVFQAAMKWRLSRRA
jgi:membrane-associated phospholipid phosphatase